MVIFFPEYVKEISSALLLQRALQSIDSLRTQSVAHGSVASHLLGAY